jgi:hypothetical protein
VTGEAHLPVYIGEGLVREVGYLPTVPNATVLIEDLDLLVGIVL